MRERVVTPETIAQAKSALGRTYDEMNFEIAVNNEIRKLSIKHQNKNHRDKWQAVVSELGERIRDNQIELKELDSEKIT
jgi:hypothetical protein